MGVALSKPKPRSTARFHCIQFFNVLTCYTPFAYCGCQPKTDTSRAPNMTVAVCFKCGTFKWGAFNPCEKCGAKPAGHDELALSMSMSDHYFEKPELERISAEIEAGRPAPIEPTFVQKLRNHLASPQGERMMGMFQPKPVGAVSPQKPVTNNVDKIAKRLVSFDARKPGAVRMLVNPFMLSEVVEVLGRLGLEKPFFTGAQQFLCDSVLKYEVAMARILPSSMLAGPANSDGLIQCWAGSGRYVGEQGLLQMPNFTSGGKDRVVLIVDVEPFFEAIADLLDEAKRRS